MKVDERRFTLSAVDFALFNPNTRTCPVFRTSNDMDIARKMYHRAGVLWKEARGTDAPELNPWGVKFSAMFHMSNDSNLFKTREELEDEDWELEGNIFFKKDEEDYYLPLYEAKLFHQYDHRFATFDGVSNVDIKEGNAKPMTSKEKADPQTISLPRNWVPQKEVAIRLDKLGKTIQLTDREIFDVLTKLARRSVSEILSVQPTNERRFSR